MAPLPTDLRNQLERAVKNARREAEAGARNALESLAVGRHEPHGSMPPEERTLRNRLRAHGRQLGDVRDKVRGTQSIDRLAHEVAYEHWHRMLFARFLAENGLLIEPETGVAISMEECEELAREAGEDHRSMAAHFAQGSLPQIFRTGDPVLEVTLAPETQQALDKLLDALPAAVFTADDSLGWTYQYWQAEKKKAVNDSGVKIGADELPAVTQLFTEHYMVLFLYHNTIGAWHAGKVLAENPDLAETAQSEEELRQAVRLRSQGGYDFEYLRFVREAKEGDEEEAPTGAWRPAAGIFEGWPKTGKELKVLDPCCGSGHFLIEGFELLVRLRMDEEGLALENAIRGVLDDNLHGLELDPRCTQIAAFNLAMATWKLADRPIELPTLHIACSGLEVGSTKKEWVAFAGEDEPLIGGMQWLYEQFELAPELGSLVDPSAQSRDLRQLSYDTMAPLLASALKREAGNEDYVERGVAAQGMVRATELLSRQYTLVITNVPYLGRGQQSDLLKDFAGEYHKEAKADIATIFVSRIFRWLGANGAAAVVAPQNWLFLASYEAFRQKLLTRRSWNFVAQLGEGAFDSAGAAGAFTALLLVGASRPAVGTRFGGLKATLPRESCGKSRLLRTEPIRVLQQSEQLSTPDARVVLSGGGSGGPLLSSYASSFLGLGTGDFPTFGRCYWEVNSVAPIWSRLQSAVLTGNRHGGRRDVVAWDRAAGRVRGMSEAHRERIHNQDQSGQQAWGRAGVAVALMRDLRIAHYLGDVFDKSMAAVIPHDPDHLPAIWCYCTSPEFLREVRRIDQKVIAGLLTYAESFLQPRGLEMQAEVGAGEAYVAL